MTRIPGRARARSARRVGVVRLYFALAFVGLIATWYFNFNYAGSDYLGDWFANPASSSAAVDLIVIVGVAAVVYVRESRLLGWRFVVPCLFLILSVLVAVSFALPLFLGLRDRRLQMENGNAISRRTDEI